MKSGKEIIVAFFFVLVLLPAMIRVINRPEEAPEVAQEIVEEYVSPDDIKKTVTDEVGNRISDVLWYSLILPVIIGVAGFFGLKIKSRY